MPLVVLLAEGAALEGGDLELDPTVEEYLLNVVLTFLSQGTLEDEPATAEDLYNFVSPFLPEPLQAVLTFDIFNGCIGKLQSSGDESQADQDGSDNAIEAENLFLQKLNLGSSEPMQHLQDQGDENSEGGAHSPVKTVQIESAEQSTITDHVHEHANTVKKSGRVRQRQGGKRGGKGRKDQQQGEGNSAEGPPGGLHDESGVLAGQGTQRKFERIPETVQELLRVVGVQDPDPTTVEYLACVAQEAELDDEGLEDMLEVYVQIVPELSDVSSSACEVTYFFERVRDIRKSLELAEKEAKEREQSKRSTPAHQEAQPEEQAAGSEEADEMSMEDEALLKELECVPELQLLAEFFPDISISTLKHQLRLCEGDVQQAMEKILQIIEIQEECVSREELKQHDKEFEEEAREAMRQRALTYYDQVQDSKKVEVGKRPDVKTTENFKASIEKDISRMLSNDVQAKRYINNEVVGHKGEKKIYVKTKNSADAPDPKSLISLKIKGV